MFQKTRHKFLSGAQQRPQTCPVSSGRKHDDVDMNHLPLSVLEEETDYLLRRYGKGKGNNDRKILRASPKHLLGGTRSSTAFLKSKSEANIKLKKNVSFWDEKQNPQKMAVQSSHKSIEKKEDAILKPRPPSLRLFHRRGSSGCIAREKSDWACVSFASDMEIIDPSRDDAARLIQQMFLSKNFRSVRESSQGKNMQLKTNRKSSFLKKDVQRPSTSCISLPPLCKKSYLYQKSASDDTSLTGSEGDSDVEEVNNSDLFFGEKERLFSADGSTNVQLRRAISSALNPSRFESISTLLASGTSLGASVSLSPENINYRTASTPSLFPPDEDGHMVSYSKLVDRGITSKAKLSRPKTAPVKRESLALRKVTRQSFDLGLNSTPEGVEDDVKKERKAAKREICFNCWSAGTGKKCMQHQGKDKTKHGEKSLSLCKNWDIDLLRRRYRSEEIHEVFMKTAKTLRYDKYQKRFQVAVEHKHPIYRLLAKKIDQCNFTSRRKIRVRLWLTSFIDLLRSGSVSGLENDRVSTANKFLRLKNSLADLRVVKELTKEVRHLHPKPPVTGTTLPELCGKIVVFDEHETIVNGVKRLQKIIRVGPTPVPVAFYEHNFFDSSEPVSVHTVFQSVNTLGEYDVIVKNLPIHACAHDSLDNRSRSRGHLYRHFAQPRTETVATLTRRPAVSRLQNVGPRAEITIAQSVTTYMPSQYGDFRCFNKSIVRPEVSPLHTVYELPIRVDVEMQHYVERQLHDLNHMRKPLPVTIKMGSYDKFDSYDAEKARKGKQYGFRVTETVRPPEISARVDTNTFIPSQSIASANAPKLEESIVARVDRGHIYPESLSLPVSTLKFVDLLKSHTVCTPGKAQMFTCIGTQKPGQFLRRCDSSLPIGQYTSIACRSWTMVQNDTTADQYFTEDGTPYWYDIQTREAYWERPLYSKEKITLQKGGEFFGENDCTRSRTVRSGIRNAMMRKHETEEMKRRRKHVVSRALGRSKKTRSLISVSDHAIELDVEEENGDFDDAQVFDDVVPAPPCMIPFAVENQPAVSVERRPSSQSSEDSLHSCESESASISRTFLTSSAEYQTTVASETLTSPPIIDSNAGAIVDSITAAIGKSLSGLTRSEDLLKIGVGLGMSLGAQGIFHLGGESDTHNIHQHNQIPSHDSLETSESTNSFQTREEKLEEGEKEKANDPKGRAKVTGLEAKTQSSVIPALQTNSEEVADVRSQLSPSMCLPQNNIRSFSTHSVAGIEKKDTSKKSSPHNNDISIETLTEQTPNNFLGIIAATRTGKQHVDYLPYIPNLPNCRPAGRLKPRSVANDWIAIGFDPWSAGREVLRTEFISQVIEGDDLLSPGERQFAANLRERSSFAILDGDVIYQRQENSAVNDGMMAENFELVCRYVRHGKYSELENVINDNDWSLPIDYVDGAGNTLLMISCQNGNKRIAKLCLRRGGTINLQNMNGQTCLHYAFGYGFDDLGNYLILKGADDSIVNADGLTCYEGLSLDDVDAI